jgi:hypothetical protein
MIPSTHDETKSAYESGSLQLPPGLDSFGDYNTAPEPMTTITAEEYSRRLLHWQVTAIESRQPKTLGYSMLHIHWLNTGNGVGMSRQWRSMPGPLSGGWATVYWLIGCPHNNMVATKIGNCLRAQVCQDCGYITVVDSSG